MEEVAGVGAVDVEEERVSNEATDAHPEVLGVGGKHMRRGWYLWRCSAGSGSGIGPIRLATVLRQAKLGDDAGPDGSRQRARLVVGLLIVFTASKPPDQAVTSDNGTHRRWAAAEDVQEAAGCP